MHILGERDIKGEEAVRYIAHKKIEMDMGVKYHKAMCENIFELLKTETDDCVYAELVNIQLNSALCLVGNLLAGIQAMGAQVGEPCENLHPLIDYICKHLKEKF
jgi:chemotaxis protein CheY-P-specific phosphatase CheC